MTAASGAPVVIDNRATHVAKLEAVSSQQLAVRALADKNDSAGLLLRLQQVNSDASLDTAVREHLLEFTLLEMSRSAPNAAARETVNSFRSRPVNVYVRLNEGRGKQVAPMYDLSAAAKLTLRVWETADAQAWTASALSSSLWQANDYVHPRSGIALDAWQAGARAAFDSVQQELVAATRFELSQLRDRSSEFGSLLVVVARRLGERSLFDQTIKFGLASDARAAIATAHESLSVNDTIETLINAYDRSELASNAILELGARFSNHGRVRHWLLQRLGDPVNGASAALALARNADDSVLREIEAIILGDGTEMTKLRAALVLRLSASPAAMALQRRLSGQPLSSDKIQAALR